MSVPPPSHSRGLSLFTIPQIPGYLETQTQREHMSKCWWGVQRGTLGYLIGTDIQFDNRILELDVVRVVQL